MVNCSAAPLCLLYALPSMPCFSIRRRAEHKRRRFVLRHFQVIIKNQSANAVDFQNFSEIHFHENKCATRQKERRGVAANQNALARREPQASLMNHTLPGEAFATPTSVRVRIFRRRQAANKRSGWLRQSRIIRKRSKFRDRKMPFCALCTRMSSYK